MRLVGLFAIFIKTYGYRLVCKSEMPLLSSRTTTASLFYHQLQTHSQIDYFCIMEENLKRLNKFIGETGYCPCREADKIIEQERVTINGIVPELGTKVSPNDEVRIDGKLIHDRKENCVLYFQQACRNRMHN
jgi:hypothetical protein